jgi:SEC-C motif
MTINVNVSHTVVNEHGPIFHELIELIVESLRSSGIQVSCTTNTVFNDQINVLVGHTIVLPPDSLTRLRDLPNGYVVFQLEALDGTFGYSREYPAYLELLRGARQIWDYSLRNTRYLAEHGLNDVRYIPIGYSRRLARIIDVDQHDIDILFYGAVSPRRRLILEELQRRGFNTVALFGKYGIDRDDCIARAKIKLNVHQFETSHLEQLRIAYLLNNKRFVISETSDEDPYGGGVIFCNYTDIVSRCAYYLGSGMDAERARIAELGAKNLKQIPTASAISSAIKEMASCGQERLAVTDNVSAPPRRNDPCPCGSGRKYKHCHGQL